MNKQPKSPYSGFNKYVVQDICGRTLQTFAFSLACTSTECTHGSTANGRAHQRDGGRDMQAAGKRPKIIILGSEFHLLRDLVNSKLQLSFLTLNYIIKGELKKPDNLVLRGR